MLSLLRGCGYGEPDDDDDGEDRSQEDDEDEEEARRGVTVAQEAEARSHLARHPTRV